MTTNPCFSCTSTPDSPKTNCTNGTCLCFCDIYISPKSIDAVACEQTGVLDLKTQDQNTTVCGTTPVSYTLLFFDTEFFKNVTISNGVVSWTPKRESKE